MPLDQSRNPQLGIDGFRYSDLYDGVRLSDLNRRFHAFFEERDPELWSRFRDYRENAARNVAGGGLPPAEESRLIVEAARPLSDFLSTLFLVREEMEIHRERARRDAEVSRFKKDFVIRRVVKTAPASAAAAGEMDAVVARLIGETGFSSAGTDDEYDLARLINRLFDLEKEAAAPPDAEGTLRPDAPELAALRPAGFGTAREALDQLAVWAAFRVREPNARWRMHEWTSFRIPHPLHFERLVPTEPAAELPAVMGPAASLRRRDGFELTDPRFGPREISDEANYCIYCHERDKDSCSTGFIQKDGTYRRNPLGVALTGCPLDEKIGESNLLRSEGDPIGALAIIVIDNPMCPGTGHRICNDCMKSCIFQKQEPVNIPQVETGSLTDVLGLPFGFEIYSLLTRWNPLNVRREVMAPSNGRTVLVVGLGPAGYTLAHHLANEGFGVVGIDGLKLEPLPREWVGGPGEPPLPIGDIDMLRQPLDRRILSGFGGVSEYGITVRWDKNFLTVIRLALERRDNIRFYGGTRFGGTITIEDAFDELGFDHIAIAAGAGTPTLVRMKNNLTRGIRQASDFLMALQLTGAFKEDSLANLQVRLPAVVIGGGLTAIDTATELFAYYPLQVEKVLERFERLSSELGEEVVRATYDPEEVSILDEFLAHGAAIRAERSRAATAGESPDFIPLVRSWGGVTLAYRKGLTDSPAYRLNHEEVAKAFEEGIAYAENLSPIEAVSDANGHLSSIIFEEQIVEDGRWLDSGKLTELPARTAMIAAGTSPNTIYEKEYPGTFRLDSWGQFFLAHRAVVTEEGIDLVETPPTAIEPGFFTSWRHRSDPRKLISFYGDNHPRYAGNVVKAMASAKDGFRHVADLLPPLESAGAEKFAALTARLDDLLHATVVRVDRLTPTIVEVIVRAPLAARKFLPGQFYRLQNFETLAEELEGTRLVMEGLALTGASTDPEAGLLSLIVLEMGGSSRLCARLQPGEPVVVMGPTGTPTEIPKDETVILAGGGLGNAVLFSIARALKNNGCTVIYFAGYKKGEDLFKQDEIEAATDCVIWSVDRGAPIAARRDTDASFVGNIVQCMLAYELGQLTIGAPRFSLREASRIIAIGSDGMMRAVGESRRTVLAPHLSPAHTAIGSINSPMQCMMKQVCAQCLQRHVDPLTGKESFIFSCFNQDQDLDVVDFGHLRARLRQNTVTEKLTHLWLTRLLASANAAQRNTADGAAGREMPSALY